MSCYFVFVHETNDIVDLANYYGATERRRDGRRDGGTDRHDELERCGRWDTIKKGDRRLNVFFQFNFDQSEVRILLQYYRCAPMGRRPFSNSRHNWGEFSIAQVAILTKFEFVFWHGLNDNKRVDIVLSRLRLEIKTNRERETRRLGLTVYYNLILFILSFCL